MMSSSYKEIRERREAEERQAEEKNALLPLSVSLGIQRLKLNPAIKFIASDSQAGEKRKELASRVQGLALRGKLSTLYLLSGDPLSPAFCGC